MRDWDSLFRSLTLVLPIRCVQRFSKPINMAYFQDFSGFGYRIWRNVKLTFDCIAKRVLYAQIDCTAKNACMSDNPKETIIKLDELERHHCAVVHHVEATNEDMARLMAMGVCAGRTVELVQRGDPLILKVFGSRIGVSARLACRVMVRPCGIRSYQSKLEANDALL